MKELCHHHWNPPILDALEDMAGDCNEAKYLSHVALENGLATFRGVWDMSGLMFKRDKHSPKGLQAMVQRIE
ncbi:hypothetical protein M0R45_031433 [Rubus argutus]|uniref:Uncharacterized protein n=1 Tax=Rubus argutus TaxID=59490 RepID=A0AAW1WI50_RUBAR